MRWRRLTVLLLAAAGLLVLLDLPALSAERVALVIGNARYAHAPRLANPLNDAADISAALERLGFAVARLDNADKPTLELGLYKLSQAAAGAEIALVFYAGHGIEVDKRNFLVPVSARLASEQDVEFETVPLDLVMRAVGRASGLGLVVLDACRENPFVASMQRTAGTRSVGRGLARVEPAGQTLVAYAAKEGQVAADGADRNSPYTSALLAHVETPGLEIMQLFREVRDTVLAATRKEQEPFVYGSLSREKVYLSARTEPDPRPSAMVRPARDAPASDRLTAEELAAERVFWESVKDSEDPADIQAYLDRYPGGTYEVLARNRLKRLTSSAAPAEPAREASAVSPTSPVPGAVEAGLGLERSERRLIQLGLSAAGFDPGPADGLFGRGTRGAIGRWQASRGDDATGYLDAETAKLLLASGRRHEEQESTRQAAQQAERLRGEQEARQRAQREARERDRREAEEAQRRRESETLAMLREAIGLYIPQNGQTDYARARRLFQQAAQSGHALAVMWLARCYMEGRAGFRKNAERAQKLAQGAIQEIKRLARGGDLEASFLLASAYEEGLAVAKDDREAVSRYRKAADQGHVFAQHNLGVAYRDGLGVAQNYREALRWFRKAADRGDANAQFKLSELYWHGHGVAQSYAEAFRWARKAADQGSPFAQNGLGWLYQYGQGVTKDYNEAAKWYRKAADQGDALAQTNLGVMYRDGLGVGRNHQEAVRWYRKAAQQGHALAQTNLGFMYQNGLGVAKNHNEAVRWYRKAAEQGDAYAQNQLTAMGY